MNHAQLSKLWQLVEHTRPAGTEVCVHTVGIRSEDYDVCVGCDGHARRHLLVPLPSPSAPAPSFRSAGLFVRTRLLLREGIEKSYLDLVCLSPSLNEVFSHLVVDVTDAIRTDESGAAAKCLSVLEDWKELFGSGFPGMGREQVIGLVGELLILEKLTCIAAGALSHWVGPAGALHDFRAGRRALEVKASTRRHGRFFSISGYRQLEAPPNGDLHFAALKLDEAAGGALSIPTLLAAIRRNGVQPSLLQQRLNEIGYVSGASEQADNMHFDLAECLLYHVDEYFPRIVSATLAGGRLPSGVINISYEIDLSAEAPQPLARDATEAFLRSFAAGGVQ